MRQPWRASHACGSPEDPPVPLQVATPVPVKPCFSAFTLVSCSSTAFTVREGPESVQKQMSLKMTDQMPMTSGNHEEKFCYEYSDQLRIIKRSSRA
jgi:hypothetical protein